MPSIKRGHLKLNEKLSPVEITPFKADLLKHGNGMGLLALPQGEQVLELGALDPTPEDEREGWNSKVQFLLSVIAYAVGAFLIPYFIMLAVEGVPLCVLELGIGQRLRLGSIGVWNKIHPFLGGVGIASAIVAFLVGMYYTSIIGWCFFYLFSSFRAELPWKDCPLVPGSNTTVEPECEVSSPTTYFWFRQTLDVTSGIDDFGGIQWKLAGCLALSWLVIWMCMARGIENSGKIMYFTAGFPYLVLFIFFGRAITLRGASQGIMHLITPQMDKLRDPIVWLDAATQIFYSLGLGFGSLIAFGSYNPTDNNFTRDAVVVSLTNAFTGIFASLVVFAVLGFKATLGVENCACRFINDIATSLSLTALELKSISSNPEKCVEYYGLLEKEPSVYGLSAELFTNSTCTHDKFMNEYGSSLVLASLHIFSLVTTTSQQEITKPSLQASEGTGLAFIVFTQVMVELPGGPLWSIIFFMMLLALGMGSMFGNVAGLQTSLIDLKLFPWLSREGLSAISCTISFLIGLIFVTKAGMYWVGLFDAYVGSFSLLVIALCEMVGVCWIFKYSRFAADIKDMTGRSLSAYWAITLKFVAPVLIVVVLVASVAMRVLNGVSYTAYNALDGLMHPTAYPVWAQVICVFLVLLGIGPIVAVAVLRRCGIVKYEPDPSLINAGFNSSASTTMFVRNPADTSGDSEKTYNTYTFPPVVE